MVVIGTMFLIFSLFMISLTSVKGCDQMLLGDNGTISSPGWPMPYPLNIECAYDIIVSEGNLIRIEFINMSVEASVGCGYDNVKIHDTQTSTVIGTICGDSAGQVYYSSSNFMKVVFQSDEVQNDYGFVAVYSAVEGVCDEYLTGVNGTFTSPNWPDSYPTNIVCQYSIVVAEEYKVKLQISNMSIELEDTCSFDSIEIKDGNQSLGIFCGQFELEPFYSSSNELSVTFISDAWAPLTGFLAEYTAVTEVGVNNHTIYGNHQNINLDVQQPSQEGCPDYVTFEGLSGTITSPNYPFNYPLNVKCSYGIIVPVGMLIKLTFTNFEVELESNCNYDSLTIRDADDVYGVYCGTNTPSTVYTKQNKVEIMFSSDNYDTKKGFSLNYLAVAAPTTTPTAPVDLTILGKTSDDLMTIMLVTFGVILAVSIFAVVSGLLFCKYTKNNVQNLKKSKKKRRVIAVKELPTWPTKKVMPPLGTQINYNVKPLENKIDLAMVDA